MPASREDWARFTDHCRTTLQQYTEPLLRAVASQLVKLKIGQTADDLAEKAAETLTNPPVIDRRIRDLPEAARTLLRLLGLSRQPTWSVGQLMTLAAASGHSDGLTPVQTLLAAGLLYPVLEPHHRLDDFTQWLGRDGTLTARAVIHPAVAARARGLMPSRSQVVAEAERPGQESDGLDWPLRLAAVWQQSRPAPVRLTQTQTLYKRDLARLQADPVLASPFLDFSEPVPDAGVLAFEWACALGLLIGTGTERSTTRLLPFGSASLFGLLSDLFATFFHIETWDPLTGYGVCESGLSPTPTAGLVILDTLAHQPGLTATAAELAEPIWAQHPSLPSRVSREVAKTRGEAWVRAFLLGIAYPLRLVELLPGEPRRYRLSSFGRHLLLGGPEPSPPPSFPQTLFVQPNAEMIAYRQGLTPPLLAELSRFAAWKQIGPACTLELTPEETYRGLESGLTLAAIKQTLDRHTARPVPPAVLDLLKRWADKRERIMIFPDATLVEFVTPAELDDALNRGIVSIQLSDRIGLTADGSDPDFSQLRLIGNRDYDGKPVQCVTVSPDGVTLTVDAAQSDLLLEAEITRLAEPLEAVNGVRKYRLTPDSLHRAVRQGATLESLDRWFTTRTGAATPAAGRLLVSGRQLPELLAQSQLVLRVESPAIADGLCQWPDTAEWIVDRLGPTAMVIERDHLPELQRVLDAIGMRIRANDAQP